MPNKKKMPKITYATPDDPLIKTLLIRSIERLSGQPRIERMYDNVLNDREENMSFWEAALEQLQLHVEYDERQLAKIPRGGPLVFIANHPYGVLDGIIICNIAVTTRQDFQILINSALCREEEVAEYMLPIDFAGTEKALRTNIKTKRRSEAILKAGGTIVIFPAGGIATSKGPFGQAVDLEWKTFAAKLIQTSKATVVPIYFHGQNSRIFQIVSQFSLTLRLSLIISEVNRKIGETIKVSIGDPIPYQDIADIKKRQALTDYLREVTYGLSYSGDELPQPDKKRGIDLQTLY